MRIDIEDYLSPGEMKEIAREEFHKLLSSKSERILSNLAYYLGEGFIQSLISDEEVRKLQDRATKILKEDSNFETLIYSKPTGDLVVYNEVQTAIRDNIDIVRDKGVERLTNLDLDKFEESFDASNILFELIKGVKQ